MVTQEHMAMYDSKLSQLDTELERRKVLGERFLTVMIRMRQLMNADDKDREEHQVRE